MRPLPSISAQSIPRLASCAARIVPENPPPMIATGTRRSDFIVRPILRIRSVRFAAHHVLVHPVDGLASGLGKPPGHCRMDQAGETGSDELGRDNDGPCAMRRPAHAERARMLEEEPIGHSRPRVLMLPRRHLHVLTTLATP